MISKTFNPYALCESSTLNSMKPEGGTGFSMPTIIVGRNCTAVEISKTMYINIGTITVPSTATGFCSSTVSKNISNINCYRIVDQPWSTSFLLLCYFFQWSYCQPLSNAPKLWANCIHLSYGYVKDRLAGVLPDFRTTSRQRPPEVRWTPMECASYVVVSFLNHSLPSSTSSGFVLLLYPKPFEQYVVQPCCIDFYSCTFLIIYFDKAN